MQEDVYENRIKKEEFQNFLSSEFFNNEKIEITPNAKQSELLLKIGEEKERPIYDLGEGLQMIILMTFPLFFYDNGFYVIEEPEIFLHPSLQRRILEKFISHPASKDFIFFISTHSNHILDISNYHPEVSIFSMQKELPLGKSNSKKANFYLNNLVDNGESALELLGVNNTSVFLSNSSIWIEGITDMLYIRKYIESYLSNPKLKEKYKSCRSYVEGVHYSFIFSGGSNIIHYDFSDEEAISALKERIVVKKLCGKAFVIVDSDGKKHDRRKKQFFNDLGGRFYELPTIEIENLLPNEAIIGAIKSYPTLKEIKINENLYLDEKDYKNIRLGSYIENYLLEGTKGKRKHFTSTTSKSDNQTISGKVEFCKKTLPFIKFENMTKASKILVEAILDFLMQINNKG